MKQQDAKTYAKWGIDYLKYDLCSYIGIMRKEAPNDQAKQMQLSTRLTKKCTRLC